MISRTSNIIRQIKLSLVFKLLAFIFFYMTVSLQLKILGTEIYGVWATLLSIVTWIVFFDLGIGNGLKNYLTKAINSNNIVEAKRYIATGYLTVIVISFVFFAAILLLASTYNLNEVFNTNVLSDSQLKKAVILLFLFICIHFVLGFVKQFIFAVQKNSLNDMEQCLFFVILFCGLFTLSFSKTANIFDIIIIYGAALIVGKVVLTLLFFYLYKELLPSFDCIRKSIIFKLVSLGGVFFILQLVSMFILLSDRFILTQLIGPKSVTEYDVIYRMLSVFLVLHSIVNAPMWSAYTEAYSKSEFQWIKKSIFKMNSLVLLFIPCSIVVYIFYNDILFLWLGKDLVVSESLVASMCMLVLILSWCNNYAFFLNAINRLKIQLFSLLFGAVIKIPLAYYFVSVLDLGVSGVVYSTVIALSFFAIAGPIEYKILMRSSK